MVWKWLWNTETKYYDDEITRDTDWGGDESTGNQPVSGGRVQEWLKNEINGKFGVIRISKTVNDRSFYSLEMFSTKEDEQLYDADPETYADRITIVPIPISTVEGDTFSALLRSSFPMTDVVITGSSLVVPLNFRAVRVTTGTVPTYVGHSLLLEGKTSLRLYFRGATTDGYTFWANGTELTLTQKGGNYYAEIPDIGSLALFTRYDVKILKDGVVQGRMVVSPLTYALAIVESTDEAESNLAKALYAYNLAAQNYNDVNFGLDIQW